MTFDLLRCDIKKKNEKCNQSNWDLYIRKTFRRQDALQLTLFHLLKIKYLFHQINSAEKMHFCLKKQKKTGFFLVISAFLERMFHLLHLFFYSFSFK